MAEIGDRPRWRLPDLGDGTLLVVPGHVAPPKASRRVPASALRGAIRRWLADGVGRALMMQLYRAVTAPFPSEPQSWSNGEIEDELEPVLHRAFEERRLVAYLDGGLDLDAPPGPEPKPPHPKPHPKPRPKPEPKPHPKPHPKPEPKPHPKPEPPKITTVSLVSLTIASDHQLMKDNASTWLNTGRPYPEPEWTPSARHPVSHTMDSAVALTVALEVGPPDGTPEMGVLVGTGPDQLAFESAPLQFKPGAMTVELTSKGKLKKKIHKLDFAIAWQIRWQKAETKIAVSPARTANEMFVTMGTPREEDGSPDEDELGISMRMDGVTIKRMRAAMAELEPFDSLDPHVIVRKVFKFVPRYTLITSKAVPAQYRHAGYLNQFGGAWPLLEYKQHRAECQAIVRMVSAVIHQLGVPGDTKNMMVWADPLIEKGNKVLEEEGMGGLDSMRVRNGKVEHARLSDSAVEVGKTYQNEEDQPGMNRYEACLRFEYGGEVVYYGGGAGEYPDKESVIEAFWGLVWIRLHPSPNPDTPSSYTVTEIVKRWR